MRQITTCNLHRILQIALVAVNQEPPYPRRVWGGGEGGLCKQAGMQPAFMMVRRSSEIICNRLKHDLQSPWNFANRSKEL